MTAPVRTIPYNFAVLRVVPHVHIGSAVPVGVILHAPTVEFVGIPFAVSNRPAREPLMVWFRVIHAIAFACFAAIESPAATVSLAFGGSIEMMKG